MFEELQDWVEDSSMAPTVVLWLVVVITFWYLSPMTHFTVLMKIILTVAMLPITYFIVQFIGNR